MSNASERVQVNRLAAPLAGRFVWIGDVLATAHKHPASGAANGFGVLRTHWRLVASQDRCNRFALTLHQLLASLYGRFEHLIHAGAVKPPAVFG